MKLTRIITLNMQGDDIKWLQEKLVELNFYRGKCNGHYNQDTLVAVTGFQRSIGVKPDGIVSLQTWCKLPHDKITKTVTKTDLKLSFVDENGLKIYNSNISEDYYYEFETPKDIIWIKNSLTSYDPTIDNWDKAYDRDKQGNLKYENENLVTLKSSTTFTIGGYSSDNSSFDGKIFKNYNDEFWSYHSPFLNSDKKINTRCISIEICNYGPLTKKDNIFYTKTGIIVPKEEVFEMDFRGYKYWHKYTNAQIESLSKLITHLSKKWNMKIEKDIYNLEWFDYNKKHNGCIRTDSQISFEKFGISPQIELIQMLNNL